MTVEKLLKATEEGLDVLRRQYIPLIEQAVLTGYNIYSENPRSGMRLSLHYLHAYLRPDDVHFNILLDKLREVGVVERRVVHKKPSNLRDFLAVSEFLIDEFIGGEILITNVCGSKKKFF